MTVLFWPANLFSSVTCTFLNRKKGKQSTSVICLANQFKSITWFPRFCCFRHRWLHTHNACVFATANLGFAQSFRWLQRNSQVAGVRNIAVTSGESSTLDSLSFDFRPLKSVFIYLFIVLVCDSLCTSYRTSVHNYTALGVHTAKRPSSPRLVAYYIRT